MGTDGPGNIPWENKNRGIRNILQACCTNYGANVNSQLEDLKEWASLHLS